MIDRRDVTACLVTRGDQPEMMDAIRDSLIFPNVIVWDNSREPDWKCAGRYMAAALADTDYVWFQDDDVLVPENSQAEMLRLWGLDRRDYPIIAAWGHGDDPDGYDDLPLVCGGAIARKQACWDAIRSYQKHWPVDEEFMYEADFAVGVLYAGFKHVRLPFNIELSVAQSPKRLCNQPWQRDLKYKITERARAIRDQALVPA